MQAKMLAVAGQAGLAFFAWWMTRTEDERHRLQAAFWQEVEARAMSFAKDASDFAAYCERKYKQAVTV